METKEIEKKLSILLNEVMEIKHFLKNTQKIEQELKPKRTPANAIGYKEQKEFIEFMLIFGDKSDEDRNEPNSFGKSLDSILEYLNSYGEYNFNKISLAKLLISIYGKRVKHTYTKKSKRFTYYLVYFAR